MSQPGCFATTSWRQPGNILWCSASEDVLLCPACPTGAHRYRCGCFEASEFLVPPIVLCSPGVCMPDSCPPGQYALDQDINLRREVVFTQTQIFGAQMPTVVGLQWTFGCFACDLCHNQRKVTDCDGTSPVPHLCVDCQVGYWCSGGFTDDACTPGWYCAGGARIECDPMKAMHCDYSLMTAPIIGCEEGQFYTAGTEGLCTPCRTGTYLDATGLHTRTACDVCAVGTYQFPEAASLISSAGCRPCSAGFFSSAAGSSQCTACAAGAYQNLRGGTHCVVCVAGERWVSRTEPCALCEKGQYSSISGASTCPSCAVGTYSQDLGATACTPCDADKSTRLFLPATPPQLQTITTTDLGGTARQSSDACKSCAPGWVVDEQHDCVQCPVGWYCPGLNAKHARTPVLAGQYLTKLGDLATDDGVATCSVCGAGFWRHVNCSVGNAQNCGTSLCYVGTNTDCRACQNADPMVKFVSVPCGPTSNTQLASCVTTLQPTALIAPGAICNPCLPGTHLSQGLCVLCDANFFSADGVACIACPSGTVSGPGAGKCTVQCPANNIAPDGVTCQSLRGGAKRVVGEAQRLQVIGVGVRLSGGHGIVVVNNRGGDTGLLWLLSSDITQEGLIVAGGGSNQQQDGVGGLAGLGEISGLVPSLAAGGEPNTFLLSEANSGRLRVLTYLDSAMAFRVVTTRTLSGMRIGGVAVVPVVDAYLVTDLNSHSVWLTTPESVRLLRGGAGVRSIGFSDTRSYFSNPTALAMQPDDTVLVLDDYGIWTFSLNDVITKNTVGICGGGLVSDIIATAGAGLSCLQLNFAAMRVNSMATGVIRGQSSVVFNVDQQGVAYTAGGLVHLLVAGGAGRVFFDGAQLFACSSSASGAQVVEIGLDTCLCDAGLYCRADNCVQAPVGGFAPSWSSAATSCRAGTVAVAPGASSRETGCRVCPIDAQGHARFTTHQDGAVNCEVICTGGQVFNSLTKACVDGCTGAGQRYIASQGVCEQCPWGSGSNGVLCQPCPAGQKAVAAGVCAACADGTTTIFDGADRCVGAADCADGGSMCEDHAWAVTPGITSLSSAGGQATVYAGSDPGGLWRLNAAANDDEHAVAEQLSAAPHTFGLIQVNDEETTIYGAGIGAHCIWQLSLLTAAATAVAGQCGNAGDADGARDYARFTSIQALAYMHVEGRTPLLFVSSEAAGCGSIRAVSLFDFSVSTFASYNELRGNRFMLAVCMPNTMGLHTVRGLDLLYYFSDDLGIVQTRNDGDYEQKQLVYSSSEAVLDMCVKPSPQNDTLLIAFLTKKDATHTLNLYTEDSGDMRYVPGVMEDAATLDCSAAGQRYWVGSSTGMVMRKMAIGDGGGCVGGYLSVMLSGCMQLGAGQYSVAGGNLAASCRTGTFGAQAGAWSHTLCKPCAAGYFSAHEGALQCEPCPDSLPLSLAGGCVAQCPPSTFRALGACTPCPAGMTSSSGSLAQTDCRPCAAGFYVNVSTGGACVACPAGFSSPAGSHHCVVVCGAGQCSRDGVKCIALTENWEMLTSIQLVGSLMRAVTVSRGGSVFYSDGNSISYFLDDCVSGGSAIVKSLCQKTGQDLLTLLNAADGGVRGINSMVVARGFIDDKTFTRRYMYVTATSTHSIYRLPITFQPSGAVDVQATRSALGGSTWLSLLHIGSGKQGFRDGPFGACLFDTPTELELAADDASLYISDYNNNRVRVADLVAGTVRTLFGNGMPCWRAGGVAGCASSVPTDRATLPASWCDSYMGECATGRRPMGLGLSRDNSELFVTMLDDNALGRVTLGPGGAMTVMCSLNTNLANNAFETCDQQASGSRSCFLLRPYDVAATDQSLFVAVTNGVTRIDLDHLTCAQVSGKVWDMWPTDSLGNKDGEKLSDGTCSSRVNNPFKLVFAADTGILYAADLSNAAVRRIFVDGICVCPEGSQYVESAKSCYNPAEVWATGMLVLCDQEGFFALEGDTQCRSCMEAVTLGISVPNCVVWSEKQKALQVDTAGRNSQLLGAPFSKVAATPEPIGYDPRTDWFGILTAPLTRLYDDIANDQTMLYNLRPNNDGAPALSLTYQPPSKAWQIEPSPSLQPVRLMPGLWYPCGIVSETTKECACSKVECSFGDVGPWNAARQSALRFGGQIPSSLAQLADGSAVWGWSRFMLLPGVTLQYVQEKVPLKPIRADNDLTQTLVPSSSAAAGLVGGEKCYVGWPAQHTCPAGYVWSPLSRSQLPAQQLLFDPTTVSGGVACLSCLPGSYSIRPPLNTAVGGPYRCERCFLGEYSAVVGASVCGLCPIGSYSDVLSGVKCTRCPTANFYTLAPAAQDISQCTPCEPGTGGCASCVPGYYQHQAAQSTCEPCGQGSISTRANATACTPCPIDTFQAGVAGMVCHPCPVGYYAPMPGASACTVCSNANCPLSVGGVCGRGCGLNYYWDETTHQCAFCPANTLNTDYPCALDATKCWTPRAGKYFSSAANGVMDCPVGQTANANFQGCDLCTAGKRYVEGMGCVACGGGQYSTGAGVRVCATCPPGTYTPPVSSPTGYLRLFDTRDPPQAGFTACLACAAGNFSVADGSSQCGPCRAGTYATGTGSRECTKCPRGTFSSVTASPHECAGVCNANDGMFSGEGASACTYCAGGTVNSSSCEPCGLGMFEAYYNGGRTCLPCPPGLVNIWNTTADNVSACRRCPVLSMYAGPRGDLCIDAGVGYAPTADGTNRSACPAGSYRGQNDTAASACLLCAPGTFAAAERSEACAPCGLGQYALGAGRTGCRPCLDGGVADQPGSAQCHACGAGHVAAQGGVICEACPPNTYSTAGDRQCYPCMDNTAPYAPSGSSACIACPDWTVMSGDVCSGCAAGRYMLYSVFRGYYCQPCPDGTMTPHAGANASSQCQPCEAGLVASDSHDACVSCPAGKQKNVDACVACALGYYSGSSMPNCAQCPAGQYSSGVGASACQACETGRYGNTTGATACALCEPGTYANQTRQVRCAMCEVSAVATEAGAVHCRNRTTRCSPGHYVQVHTDKPDMDNGCAVCAPCTASEYTVTASQQLYWLGQLSSANATGGDGEIFCPGDTTYPLYQCMSNQPEAGYYLSVGQLAGASGAAAAGGFTVTRQPCQDLVDTTSRKVQLMMYVAGKVPGCFLGCQYGVLSLASYTSMYVAGTGDNPFSNVFYPAALDLALSLCRPCPTSGCGLGTYRPRVTDTCGPPCPVGLLSCDDGCTGTCRPVPTGAIMIDGSRILGDDRCRWVCGPGWHLADDEQSCRNCSAENPATYCDQGYVLVDTAKLCFSTSKRTTDLCKPCALNVTGGKPRAWNAETQACTYECLGGYFAADATNTTCLPCAAYNAQECPVGTFRDYVGCLEQGTAPLCKPCLQPATIDDMAYSFTTNGGLNASNCSALCGAGFHTLSSGGAVVETALNVFAMQCVVCDPQRDTITCHGACQPGQFRNRSVVSGLTAGACMLCITSEQCGIGKYARACSGNESANVGCLDCSMDLVYSGAVQVRDFVPYTLRYDELRRSLIYPHNGDCPSVCKPNYILAGAVGECVSCQKWVTVTQSCHNSPSWPAGQPQACDFVYSHWNATPGPMWWTASLTPSFHMAYRASFKTGDIVPRAGVCWACPYGEGTLDGDADLCTLLPGFGRAVENQRMKRVAVPVLGPDVVLALQEPPMPFIEILGARRLLLSLPPSSAAEQNVGVARRLLTTTSDMNVACQVGYYKPDRGDTKIGCYACPHGTSTVGPGSSSPEQCVCLPGNYRLSAARVSDGCVPCPADSYLPYMNASVATCLPCPANETTFGQPGSTACACRWGMVRFGTSRECAPCLENTYCRPCMQGEVCTPDRVVVSQCFIGSVSPPGSTSIRNCTCVSGLVALLRGDGNSFYCGPVPPMAVYDPVLARVKCQANWQETWSDDGQLVACTLCAAGQFASVPVVPTLSCNPCPVGSYAATQDVIGNCTPCPPFLSTPGTGSTSIKACGCPPPMVPAAGGGCEGCRADQYSANGVCRTCPLFSMGKAGGASIDDCQCMPGYSMTTGGECALCDVGSYSAFAGGKACKVCPAGSTTLSRGSQSIRDCSVCLGEYVWMDKMGCIPRSLQSAVAY